MYWTVPRMWVDHTVIVMASGQSLTRHDADTVRHLPRIVTNGTYRIARDADIIYGSDAMFWIHPDYADVWTCPGIKVSVEQITNIHPNTPEQVRVLRNRGADGFTEEPGHIKTGGNSGYAAIHLAASAGANRIILLGLDMTGTHWHGKHPVGLNNPRETFFVKAMRRFELLAPALRQRGIEVLNCSPISQLECFPKARLADCI